VSTERLCFDRARFESLIESLERMASGDLEHWIAISRERDELDALAHGVNVLSRELLYRLSELQRAQSSLVQAGKLAALGELTSGLAHELNNPLTIISGYLDLIRLSLEENPGAPVNVEELGGHLRKVERNVDRMSVIVRHFVEFARGSQPVKRPAMLNDIIEKSFILINEQLRHSNIAIATDLCVGVMVKIDTSGLEQVFINMLSNARDAILEAHGDAGGTIQVCSRLLSGSEVDIEISDNGIGMTEEVRSKIFNPFFTTKEVGKGTGLGLSISHGIVKDHGGSIGCVSERGKGTQFHIRLPRYDSAATPL